MHDQEKLHRVTLEAAELSDDLAKKKQLLEKIEAKMQHAEEVCHPSRNHSNF